jgi:hypothetical protein
VLTLELVKEKIEGELNPLIQYARDMSDKLRLHVDGNRELLTAKLEQINNYENEEQYIAREKHAISNKFLTEELLRPVDNAFNAKGGSKNYLFTTDIENKLNEFKKYLANIKHGLSLTDFIQNIWFHKFITDPNGLIFLELEDNPHEIESINKPEPCYKSIYNILDYKQNGQFVDWVIFEPYSIEIQETEDKKTKKIKSFWAVDEIAYYEFISVNGELSIKKRIDHEFLKVPAILCSNIIDNVTGLKISPIWSQVELLDKYLVTNSVLSIAEFSHNYPREWIYVPECKMCGGSGTDYNGDVCGVCGGLGKAHKDVANIIELKVPTNDETNIAPPTGYVTFPTEGWKLMVDSADRYWDIIYFSHWGTTVSKDTTNETATGRFLDAQPVNNRLGKYSKSIEIIHTLLADLFGTYYFPETFIKSEIKYGDRYLIETPDQIWEKYLKAKEKNAPITQLNLLLYQFIESEYKDNNYILDYELKKIKMEPFIHWDIETVRKSENISILDKTKKEYFNEWCSRLDKNYIIKTDIKILDNEFTEYVQLKINENGKTKLEEEVQSTLR